MFREIRRKDRNSFIGGGGIWFFGHVGDKWVWVWNPDQLCKGRGFYLFPLRSGRV